MSKKRGLSLDEKKLKVLEIFHTTRDVYQLKDIEKHAPKLGVISQSVKEVVQSLVDDDLIHQEKIGASNFFWSFPSEAAVKLQNEVQKLEMQIKEELQREATLQSQLEQSKAGKEDSDERTQKLAELGRLEAAVQQLTAQIGLYADNDPKRLEAMRQGADIAKDAANRWLDNTYNLQSWCKKRFEGMDAQLDEFFKQNGLTDDIDYLE
eukprot:jgi/Botrbrau1/21913/Bobra.0249s0040.2